MGIQNDIDKNCGIRNC